MSADRVMCMIISKFDTFNTQNDGSLFTLALPAGVDYVSATRHAYGHSVLGVDGSMRAAELWRW